MKVISDITFGQSKSHNTALARIEAAKATGSKELDLSSLGLEELPDEVFELTDLRVLKAMRNNLTSLHPGILKLRKLDQLYLADNKIKNISDYILTEMPYVDCFDIGDNPFDYHAASMFFYENNRWKGYKECLKEIEQAIKYKSSYISFRDLDIKTFPSELYSLEKLYAFTISNCTIDVLPIGISKLSNLRELVIEDNIGLSQLPEDIQYLQNLNLSAFTGKSIKMFPQFIPEIKSLRRLVVDFEDEESFERSMISNLPLDYCVINGRTLVGGY